MTSFLRCTHEIGRKLKVVAQEKILNQKGREVFKMTKNQNFERKLCDFL